MYYWLRNFFLRKKEKLAKLPATNYIQIEIDQEAI